LKEKAPDRTPWRSRLGRSDGSVKTHHAMSEYINMIIIITTTTTTTTSGLSDLRIDKVKGVMDRNIELRSPTKKCLINTPKNITLFSF
jgi:hypothetical protein